MLKYRPLDLKRNEIRLLTVLGFTTQYSEQHDSGPQEKLVECLLEHFSLDEYTPQYSRFLKDEAAGRSPSSMFVLWQSITHSENPSFRKATEMVENPRFALLHKTLHGLHLQSPYSNKYQYNENTTRWTWGDYDALSYLWGDPAVKRHIIVNKQKIAVRKNLADALENYLG